MIVIAIFVLFAIFYLMGILVLKALRVKENTFENTFITGFFSSLVLFEIPAWICIFAGSSFEVLELVTCIVFTVIPLCGAIWGFGDIKRHLKGMKMLRPSIRLLPPVLYLATVIGSFFARPAFLSDAVLDTIRTTIYEGSLFVVNPMTGEAFDGVFSAWDKLVALPLFYAVWCDAFGVEAELFLKTATPTIMETLLYVLSYCWAVYLYGENRKKISIYLIGVGALLLFGAYSSFSIAHRVRFLNFSGSTLMLSILIPYFMYLILKIWEDKEQRIRNIILAAILCLASLCCLKITVAAAFLSITVVIIMCVKICTKCLPAVIQKHKGGTK